MHSWYRSLLFRSMFLPAAGMTMAYDCDSTRRRRSSPTTEPSKQKECSNFKQLSPSILSATLVVSDPSFESNQSSKWTCNNSQLVDETDDQGLENIIFKASSLSVQQGAEGLCDGALSSDLSSSQIEELVIKESKDKNMPLVILFGWAGCRDRYLSKYSAYYERSGFAVVRYTVPITQIRSFSSYRKFALEIYETILQQEADRPIFFHMFSMNGCSLFTALWDLLDNVSDDQIKQRVKGLIFDSSPANVLPWQAANAVSFATFPPGKSATLQREAYRLALAGIFSVHRALVWLQSNFNDKTYQKHFAFFRLQCFNDLPKNQLFLYSDADDICVRHSIEHFQSIQTNKNNAKIKKVCWADSPHCQHYRFYEEEYTQECIDFVRNSVK